MTNAVWPRPPMPIKKSTSPSFQEEEKRAYRFTFEIVVSPKEISKLAMDLGKALKNWNNGKFRFFVS